MASNNLDDLTRAAKLKLEAQKKEAQKEVSTNNNNDIYASIRQETEVNTPEFNIAHNPNESDQNYNIQHNDNENEQNYILDNNEILEYEDAIYPGGPGVAQIDIWKKQYGANKVYHVQVINRDFIFRTLNRFEYKQIVALENVDALQREEIICQQTVLWPMNYDFKTMGQDDGGYPSTLSQIIMESSGFTKEYGIEML